MIRNQMDNEKITELLLTMRQKGSDLTPYGIAISMTADMLTAKLNNEPLFSPCKTIQF
jgi:hypothetical protein